MSEIGTHNIRYIGFCNLADSGRRLEYAITATGVPARKATVEIPGFAFSGPNRVTFQESAAIGYERLRRVFSADVSLDLPLDFVLSAADIEECRPRRRSAGKKA